MSCGGIPEIDLGEFGSQVQAGLRGRRYPMNGMMELTERCNLGCVHCYINQPAGSRKARESELSTAEVKGILNQAAEAGCLYMTFSGGEVFLREDFLDIYLHARRLGILVSIFTNATMITPKIADFLADVRPHMVDITLYGATKETYEKVTGVPGSYERCLRGIQLLRDRGIRVFLKTMVLSVNYAELAQMRAMAKEWGLEFRYDEQLWPRQDGGTQPYAVQLSQDEILAIDFTDSERAKEWVKVADELAGKKTRAKYVYSCG
ncbi:MAG: radical SAM protein, partial [Anaerolineaceae bacterium]